MTEEVQPYNNPELCQSCAKCCQQIWWFTSSFDDYLRYSWLDTDLVTVEQVDDQWWRIRILAPCKQLVNVEPAKKWACKVHGRVRPRYCETYPNNMLPYIEQYPEKFVKAEAEFCPALKDLLRRS